MSKKSTKSTKSKTQIKDQIKDQIKVKGVVNVKKESLIKNGYDDFSDWISHTDHVYIGRDMSFYVSGAHGSIWQNPFPVIVPGKKYKDKKQRYTLDKSLELYEKYVISNPDLMDRLHELNDKIIGCWCYPSRCHGDILSKLVKEYCN